MDFFHEVAKKRAKFPVQMHVYDLINTQEILHSFTPPTAKISSKRESIHLHSLHWCKWLFEMQQQMPSGDQIPTVFRSKVWVLELFSFISFPLQSELTFVLFFVFSLLLLQRSLKLIRTVLLILAEQIPERFLSFRLCKFRVFSAGKSW